MTGIPPALRLEAERPLLAPLPRIRYDTARVEPRRVGAPVPLVEVDAVSYSVPPSLVGTTVEVRLPVDGGVLEVRALGSVVATHDLAPPGSPPVWDPAHRRAAEAYTWSISESSILSQGADRCCMEHSRPGG